ncbi:MAG: hypothetical protein LKJ47_07685 [Bifidobacteriaceae bacterium]|jgi:hypothetical protein|nr:hypothetical protein [Bifidobacteriaceae bacterium]
MGLFAKLKGVFANSAAPQFLGDDGSLVVLHDDSIERIWGRVGGSAAADAEPRHEVWELDEVEAELSIRADLMTITRGERRWQIPVAEASVSANAAALFINRVNEASHGAALNVATFVHPR